MYQQNTASHKLGTSNQGDLTMFRAELFGNNNGEQRQQYRVGEQQLSDHHLPFSSTNGNVYDHHPEIQFNSPPFLNNNGGQDGGVIRRYTNMAVANGHYDPSCNNFTRQSIGIGAAAASSSNLAGQFMTNRGGSVFISVGRFPQIMCPATASVITHGNDNYMRIPANPFYGTHTDQGPNAAAGLPLTLPPASMFDYTTTFRPQAPINQAHSDIPTPGTQGNNDNTTAAVTTTDGSQENNSSVQVVRRRVGRPHKDSSSADSQPRQQLKSAKAIHMRVQSIKVGEWVCISEPRKVRILAKCYMGKQSLMWECLFSDTGRKKRMELEWKFIKSIQISTLSSEGHEHEVLQVETRQTPKFSHETKITAGTHASWGQCEDFTGGQAEDCKTLELVFKKGDLSAEFKKVLREHKVLHKLFQPHASSSSNVELVQQYDTQDLVGWFPSQQFTSTMTSSSHPSGNNDVAEADEEVLSGYDDPLQIQNNLAGNVSNIHTDQGNVEIDESLDWNSLDRDVGEGLKVFGSDLEQLGTAGDNLDFQNDPEWSF